MIKSMADLRNREKEINEKYIEKLNEDLEKYKDNPLIIDAITKMIEDLKTANKNHKQEKSFL